MTLRECTHDTIMQALMTIYDPEFPLIDIWTMGLIYHIEIIDTIVTITMTLTTPACPAADFLLESVKNVVEDRWTDHECIVVLTFEPVWTIDMIKDEDFKKLFS